MKPAGSLRVRLFIAAVVVIALALQFAGGALFFMFERNLYRQMHIELEAAIEQLAGVLRVDPDGSLAIAQDLAEPRFRAPLSGHYWQVMRNSKIELRSRSLWDHELETTERPKPADGAHRIWLAGPDNQKLFALIRSVVLETEAGDRETELALLIATDEAQIDKLKMDFRGDVLKALIALATLLLIASWAQITIGLSPFEALRQGLERVRLGESRRLDTELPTELRPLLDETNTLLEAQEKAVESARMRAGDLAHGLKTPLTALTVLIERLSQGDHQELASRMEQQIELLNRHIERELARTRIAAEAGITFRTPVAPIASKLIRTMQTLPRGATIDWEDDIQAGCAMPLDETDAVEVLGTLLDNARKYGASRVRIAARALDHGVELEIEDDGPGIKPEDQARVLRRGARLDETMPGTGLGLTIAKEITEAYGGSINLGCSKLGGLKARLHFSRPTSMGAPA